MVPDLQGRGARIAAAAVIAVGLLGAGAAGGWAVQGWRKDAAIASLQRDQAQGQAHDATAALEQFQKSAALVNAAASAAQGDGATVTRELKAIRQEMKNAKPLPIDCRPDDGRLRRRNAAIEAYNRAATGSVPGGAVSAD